MNLKISVDRFCPLALKWTKRSTTNFRSLKKGRYTVSRFTNAIKIARKTSYLLGIYPSNALLLLHLLQRIMSCTAGVECKIPDKTPAPGQTTRSHRATFEPNFPLFFPKKSRKNRKHFQSLEILQRAKYLEGFAFQ